MTLGAPLSPDTRPRVRLAASSTAETGPAQGIVVISVAVGSDEPGEAALRLAAPGDPEHGFTKLLHLTPEGETFWLGLHGHLLPNGLNEVALEMVGRDGQVHAAQTLTLHIRNEGGVARQVAASLKANGVPLVVDGGCDSRAYDYSDPALAPWFDRSRDEAEAHIRALEGAGSATPDEVAALRQFVDEGYLELPDVVDVEHLGRLNAALDDAVAQKLEGYEWGESQRLHNLHERYPAIRELWLHPKVLRMLSLIFGEPAKPCQSLTYVFGSEQQYHQDTVHLTPFPAGLMCGVWTALEDVQEGSGELVVFPGSHRERRVYMADAGLGKITGDWSGFAEKVVPIWTEMRGRYERRVYRPKAGTVLIWHENLMHAGSPRTQREKSRRSIVGHYFANGAIVYYDSSGLAGLVHEGD